MDQYALLKALSDAFGVSGNETEVVRIFREELSFCPHWAGDALGGGYAAFEAENGKPKVLLVAHADEVGFVVESLTHNGFIRFVTVGGWNHLTLCGQQVVLRTLSGEEIPGVIGAIPPHFLGSGDNFNEKELFIDVGARDRAELERWGIYPGCFAVPTPNFRTLKNDQYVMGKAFDDRVGLLVIIELFKKLRAMGMGASMGMGAGAGVSAGTAASAGTGTAVHTASLPCIPLAGASVQEEVGCRGARTLAALTRPDLALIIEGPPADDTPGLRDSLHQGVLGGGPQPRAYDKTTIPSAPLLKLAVDTARENGIPCQLAVRRTGSTDASQIHISDIGVPSLVISVPVRNAHSPVGILDMRDVNWTVDLLAAMLQRIDAAFVRKCRMQ